LTVLIDRLNPVPMTDADPGRSQAYAHGYGYILGLIAAAEHRAARP
jgi:hypothetical protein